MKKTVEIGGLGNVPALDDCFGRLQIRLSVGDVQKMTSLPQGVVMEVNNDPRGSSTAIITDLQSYGDDWSVLRARISDAWLMYQKAYIMPKSQVLPHPKDAELPATLPDPVSYGSTLDGVELVAYPGLYLKKEGQGKWAPAKESWTISWFDTSEAAAKATAETRALATDACENAGPVKQVTIDRQGQYRKPNLNGKRIDFPDSFRLTPNGFWSSMLEFVERNGRGSTAFVYYEGDDPLLVAASRSDLAGVSAQATNLVSGYKAEMERIGKDVSRRLQDEMATLVEALIVKHSPRFDEESSRKPRVTSSFYVRGGTQMNPDEGYREYIYETQSEVEARVSAERKAFALSEGAAELASLQDRYQAMQVNAERVDLDVLHDGLSSLQKRLMG